MSWAAAMAAIMTAGLLASCADDPQPSELRALQADPMASYVPPASVLASRSDTPAGTSAGKQVIADVIRAYNVRGSRQAAYEATVNRARQTGWTIRDDLGELSSGPRTASTFGYRTINGVGRASITITATDGKAGDLTVVIRAD
jgi:hypothetical protein